MIHVSASGCSIPPLALDRREPSPKSRWIRARKVEGFYIARLKKIAHYIEMMLRQYDPRQPLANGWIVDALTRYSETIEPWARSVGERMIAEVAARDKVAWRQTAAEMGRVLHRELDTAPLGRVVRERLDEQVSLIKSIPREAAQRVHKISLESAYTGERWETVAKKILEGGPVSRSKAVLIARTETGRTLTEITKARAEAVGSEYFRWNTSRDADVRASHRVLDGKIFRWDTPPVCDPPNHRALPSSIWNCRCTATPLIPMPGETNERFRAEAA